MNGPIDEVRRLRGELAERDRQLAELRGLVQAHIEATSDDHDYDLQRERAAYERGQLEGDERGWRRGVEHALVAVDEAHLKGEAHDHHGQMQELGMHEGPVPPRMTPEQILERAGEYDRLHAEWWFKQYQKEHAKDQPERQPAKVREFHPKESDAEREVG
jgi:hypothetical protein